MKYATTTFPTLVGIWQSFGVNRSGHVYEDKRRVEAYFRTLSTGARRGNESAWEEEKQKYIDALSSVIEVAHKDEGPDESSGSSEPAEGTSLQTVRECTQGNSFIVTERGYFGLVPAVAAVGDTCAITFGARTTCILRTTDQAEHYIFFGRFVHARSLLEKCGYGAWV